MITFDHIKNGHILIENNAQHFRQQQHCQNQMKFIDANNNNNNVRTLYSCKHQLNFIGNFNQHKRMTMTMERKKRSYSSERTIEISIVTDLSMYLYHENSLRNYVFTLIAMVSYY